MGDLKLQRAIGTYSISNGNNAGYRKNKVYYVTIKAKVWVKDLKKGQKSDQQIST